MERIHPLQNQRGFTLVEMLVAFLLMTVGVITSLSMITTALKSDAIANRLTAKASLAQQVMEDLLSRKINDDDFTTSVSNKDYDLDPEKPGNDIIIEGAGTFHAEYSTSINTPETNTTQIEIKITPVVSNNESSFSITCYKRAI